jgi:hypothetical protein
MSLARQRSRGLELDQLQLWMQAVITHPGGVASGIASEEARRGLAVDLKTLEEVVAPSSTLSGAERLAIYCQSYHARLLQCFQSMFPSLLHALGKELFNRFALDYLERHPPHSYTLDRLADGFYQHLAETRPDAEAPPDQRERWPDFIIDLALLEWAFLKVYDGAGVEGQRLPAAQEILAMEVERILDVRPVPAPCLRLFTFTHPVHAYLLAARRGQNPELPAAATSFVAMTRVNYRVRLYELHSSQYELLGALDGQQTVAQALDRGTGSGDCKQSSAGTLREWFADWVARGFFETVEVPHKESGRTL